MLNISLQTSIHSKLSFSKELDFIRKKHINSFDVFFDKSLPSDLSECDIKKLLDQKALGVQFTVHAPIEDYRGHKPFFSELITFCRLVSAYSLTIHFDQLSEASIAYFIEHLGETKLSIENTIPDINEITGKNYLSSMQEFRQKFNVFSTLDFGHAFVNGHEPLSYMKQLESKEVPISTFHCHNNEGKKDSHNTLQNGFINFELLIRYIKQNYPTSVLIIERWEDDLASFNYLNNLIGHECKV